MSGILVRNLRPFCNDSLRIFPSRYVISGRPPGLSNPWAPCPRIILTPLTHVEMNMAASRVQRFRKRSVCFFWLHPIREAPIHLDNVNTPFGEHCCILRKMTPGTRTLSHASVIAGASIEAKRQASCMCIVNDGFHTIGKVASISLQKPGSVSFQVRPTVIQVKMPVAGLIQADVMKGINGQFHAGFIAKIELWRLSTRSWPLLPKSHPAGPAQRRLSRVRSSIVIPVCHDHRACL
mmetsp:Transcript_22353/g.51835  ORF Transcript_22353/g.51835 Transcript_22353/m.51835 type:complete len:236 (+) Transcript_22353:791-1498(+)